MKQQRGFTLIELMVVVAIIAILASLAITAYSKSITKAQMSEAFSATESMKSDILAYRHQTGVCPVIGTAGAGLATSAASYSGQYVSSADVSAQDSTCVITAHFRSHTISAPLRGKQVTFTLNTSDAESTHWSCSSDAAPEYLPQACR